MMQSKNPPLRSPAASRTWNERQLELNCRRQAYGFASWRRGNLFSSGPFHTNGKGSVTLDRKRQVRQLKSEFNWQGVVPPPDASIQIGHRHFFTRINGLKGPARCRGLRSGAPPLRCCRSDNWTSASPSCTAIPHRLLLTQCNQLSHSPISQIFPC
jgi:hypothetical protein